MKHAATWLERDEACTQYVGPANARPKEVTSDDIHALWAEFNTIDLVCHDQPCDFNSMDESQACPAMLSAVRPEIERFKTRMSLVRTMLVYHVEQEADVVKKAMAATDIKKAVTT